MDRRTLLKLLASVPLASAGTLMAAPGASTRFLLVFLRGGYDAANLLVPVSSNYYYEARPNIAVARPAQDSNAALPLNADWGLHPALRETVYPLFQAGQASFIPFAGTDDTSRSHFETQDTMELGQNPGAGRNYRSGFLNRLAATLNGAPAMSFTMQLPLVFNGPAQIANADLRTAGKPSIDAHQSALISAMYMGTPLARQVSDGFAVRDEVAREMAAEMQAASRSAISTKGFATEARRIARLMKDKYNVGFVDVGGWDTHINQGGAIGTLASRLDELGRGLAAYAKEMGPAWSDTVVVVMSEFGRTFRENGNRGTDHGHGTVFWVLGGAIQGGKIAGEQIRVDAATLFQNRDFPVLNEYRAVLGGLFRRMYGFNAAQTDRIFAGVRTEDIGLI